MRSLRSIRSRLKLTVRGVVQGVGFRPFIYRLAQEMKLSGFVLNSAAGVLIEVEGEMSDLERFLQRVRSESPKAAMIFSMDISFHEAVGFEDFEIRKSDGMAEKATSILSDLSICHECRNEILTRTERRFGYPFTNCTACGPRFTIINRVPYDRPNTSMSQFALCKDCESEYKNVLDRRFHAQPIACPKCGPRLEYLNQAGHKIDGDALGFAANDLKQGLIVAIKGLGGFQILVDAFCERAINRLRNQKPREEKPFALMFPTLDLIREHCHLGILEESVLCGPESPIVLLKRRATAPCLLPENLAPGNPLLGCMLPYTPLHVLLMERMGGPVVATSGNCSDEPICIENRDALEKLSPLVDRFLMHDRPIVRHVDDSIVRVTQSQVITLRRARGYAPLPILTKPKLPSMLALGSDLKNVVGISRGNEIILSQHIGDLESIESYEAFERVIDDLKNIFDFTPEAVVTDLHPGFFSTRFGEATGLPHIKVQHHFAHMASAMVDNELDYFDEDVLGVIWDGTGYGLDGTIWGGEFLVSNCNGDHNGFRRFAHLRTFPLIGGDGVAKEPRRSALGILFDIFGADLLRDYCDRLPSLKAFSEPELQFLLGVLEKLASGSRLGQQNLAIRTSSAGRLFDAMASLTGFHQQSSFEGQAAMALEFAAMNCDCKAAVPYSFRLINNQDALSVDWEPMIREIILELVDKNQADLSRLGSRISCRFHETLAEIIVAVAKAASLSKIILSGGVFQNINLLGRTRGKLQASGFQVFSHQRIPPNDGGIAAGQLLVAASSK